MVCEESSERTENVVVEKSSSLNFEVVRGRIFFLNLLVP